MTFRRVLATSGCAVLLLLFFPLRSPAEDPSPFGRRTLSVLLIGGKNFAPGRHGLAESILTSIDAGKFVSRRLELGLDFHPWIGIRQPVHDNGDGGYKNESAFALDIYGRWYPAPVSWTLRPYLELAAGPFYALRSVPTSGSRFNFLLQTGAGVSIPILPGNPWSVVVGYRLVHISNANLYPRNPSWNFNGILLGFRRFVGTGGEWR
jgi:hypothetical protein